MNLLLLGVLGYVALQLSFGFLVSRRISTEEDYLIAGRRLGPTIAVFTIFATWFGAETCMGAAGQAFAGGLSETPAEPFGYALCILFLGVAFAAPLWRLRLVTLADLFRDRYGHGVERLAVLIMVPTSVLWAAAQVRAFGQILSASSELGIEVAVTLAAVVVIVYTSMGGMLADAISDLVQGLVLVAGLVLLAVVFVATGDAAESFAAMPAERLSLGDPSASWLDFLEVWAVPVIGSVVAQELIARVMASRSPRVARNATIGAAAMYFAVGIVPVMLGLTAVGHIEVDHPEQVLVQLASAYLPTVLHIVFAGALVSAILSTVDSALLVSGSLVAHNLVLSVRPDATEREKLLTNRVAVVIAGTVAYFMALSSQGVYDLVQEASGFGSAGIFVAMVFALYSRFGGGGAAAAAMLAGVTVYALGAYLLAWPHPFLSSLAAALACYLLGAIVCRALPWRGPPTGAG